MAINLPITVQMHLAETTQVFAMEVSHDRIPIDVDVGEAVQVITGDHYDGPVEVTPTQETQTLATQGLFVDENIVINPIPSNYGLITWNGSVLTVS